MAKRGDESAVAWLLDHGADPGIRDSMHDSDPAGWAEFFQHPRTAAVIRRWSV